MTQRKEHCYNNRTEPMPHYIAANGWSRYEGGYSLPKWICVPDRMSKECGQIAGMEPPGCTGCKYLREPL